MKYFKNPEDSQVWGYDPDQEDLVEEAIAKGWEDITGSWPPPQPEQPPEIELTPAEKLKRAGLTVDELKSLLGL